jgi:nitroreductase
VDTYLTVASRRDWRSYADRPVPADVQERIVDAGRLSGSQKNRQPWTFVLVESAEVRERLAELVYEADNVRGAAFLIAIATPEGKYPLDVGRAMQSMLLEAWNEGVASCPNGVQDREEAARALGLEEGLLPVNIPSFGYPKRRLDPESKSPAEWAAEANRKPLSEVLRRL